MSKVFCLDNLYPEDPSEIMNFLSLAPDQLTGDVAFNFKKVLFEHFDGILNSNDVWQLDSFGEGFDWLNTCRPVTLQEDLLGKIVVLDFFTFCCINCIHILPYLKAMEDKEYPGVVVIGVHSPKFPNEKDLQSVAEAVLRNKITHAVVNDPENSLWKRLGVGCWPTVVIIGPSHHILFSLVGESQIDKISFICDSLLEYFQARGINISSSTFPVLPFKETETTLLYPGNISSHGSSLIVSDSGHNRLLLLDETGRIKDIIGNGNAGLVDGSYISASFNNPHGTAYFKNKVYVADTGNHCLRLVDLEKKWVSTIYKDKISSNNNEESPRKTFLSPWDVCIGPSLGQDLLKLNTLYIAVAGSHQIWMMDLEITDTNRILLSANCVPFAGNGKEENRNNSYRIRAGFAQPSGISFSTFNPGLLFVADSESSSIRSISLIDGAVKSIIGGGINPLDLFQFGDQDGKGTSAKLQHPMSVCSHKAGHLLIADTYNHKIKSIDLEKKICTTISSSESELCEPSGICVTDKGKIIIADTNHHNLKLLDDITGDITTFPILMTKKDLQELSINNVESFTELGDGDSYHKPRIELSFKGELQLFFHMEEDNLVLTDGAPELWEVYFKGDGLKLICQSTSILNRSKCPLILKYCKENFVIGVSEVSIVLKLSLCNNISKTCCSRMVTFKFDVALSEKGNSAVSLHMNCKVQ